MVTPLDPKEIVTTQKSHQQSYTFREIKGRIKACIDHANDLLAGARLLYEHGKRNIAYHLAALALEEVGKSIMLSIGFVMPRKEGELTFSERYSDVHIKKLFWALWNPFLNEEPIPQQIQDCQDLARKIHYRRIAGLYVDPNPHAKVQPRHVITKGEVEDLINLTEARVKIQELHKLRDLRPKERKDFQWFLDAMEDNEKARIIFNRKSLNKWKDLGNSRKWVAWLRKQFQEAEKISQELLKRELSRTRPTGKKAKEPKWKYRIRLTTTSHSIRPKALNWWNGISIPIRLYPGKKKELIAEFTLPKNIPAEGFWWVGWGWSRRFIVALNIGSKGFFWWQTPKDVSRFYESLIDVENNSRVVIERSPILELNWGNNVLTQANLVNTAMVFRYLPKWGDRRAAVPFNFYVSGLTLWGKNDIHLQFEHDIFMNFFQSLKKGMQFYGHWDKKEPFEQAVERVFTTCVPRLESHQEYIRLGLEMEQRKKAPREITLTEDGVMKIMCDIYFMYVFKNLANAEYKRLR